MVLVGETETVSILDKGYFVIYIYSYPFPTPKAYELPDRR
jgi:hypothetical protein